MTEFKKKIIEIVKSIPMGEVRSYSEVAKEAGYPKAYRAVATIMKNNYDESIPCHRVIKSNGELGEYNRGGTEAKKRILNLEGYKFIDKTLNKT